MKINVNAYSVTPAQLIAGTRGSYGFEVLEFSFSEEWQGLAKKVIFETPSGISVCKVYTGTPIEIPAEVMKERGKSRFSVAGYSDNRTIYTVSGTLDVLNTLEDSDTGANAPTPETVAQVLGAMQTVLDTAESIRNTVDHDLIRWSDGENADGTHRVPAVVAGADGKMLYKWMEACPEHAPGTVCARNADDGTVEVGNAVADKTHAAYSPYHAVNVGVMKQFVCDAIAEAKEDSIQRSKIYSVRFSGSSPEGVREDDAVGMEAEVAVDGETVKNDFDRVPFFNRPICCCTWEPAAHRWKVNAYLGEPGFDWYGGNGEVMYECSPFYYRADFSGEEAPSFVSVTGAPCQGYSLAPMFRNDTDKVYCPCFELSVVDGKPSSRAGQIPLHGGVNLLMEAARKFDGSAHIGTMEIYFSETLLQWVEFATKDFQRVMGGATCLEEGAFTKVLEMPSQTELVVEGQGASHSFAPGQNIAIGSSLYGEERTASVKLADVTLDENGDFHLFLSHAVEGVSVGDSCSSRLYETGLAALAVTSASSGSYLSGTDGRHPCIWRGKENPWGNGLEGICNVLFKNYLYDGEEEYRVRMWYLPIPTAYREGALTGDYIECDFDMPTKNGYVKGMRTDTRYPFLMAPYTLGGSATTYSASYYYFPKRDISALYVGGGLFFGSQGGVMYYCVRPGMDNTFQTGRLYAGV